MDLFNKLAHKMGYISENEAIYRSLPTTLINEIETSANDLELIADPNRLAQEQKRLFEAILKSLPSNKVANGYEQAGSVLRRKFPNSMELHTFIAENHWAAAKARRHNRAEFERDGFVIMADSRVNKKAVKKVLIALEDLGIAATGRKPAMRSDMFDHIKTFGNFWVLPDTNILGGTTGLQLLLPKRLTPKYGEKDTDAIVAWYYQYNGSTWEIPASVIHHVRSYSLSKEFMGTPALSSVVLDIEADMHAGAWTNTMWQKGGLIKAIVSMESEGSSGINENNGIRYATKFQEMFARTMAGVQGSGSLLFLPPVKGVHNVVNPKDLEAANQNTGDRTAIRVCELLGCPPEVLGLSRSSQYVNSAATLDFASLSVDNDNYMSAGIVDRYISDEIIEDIMEQEGIYIQQSGEFGAISLVCAQFGAAIAKMGADIMTVNEFRTKVLHWNKLEGPEGDQYIGKYINEAMMLKAQQKDTTPSERKAIFEEMFGKKDSSIVKGREVNFLRFDPKEVKYW